MGKRYNDDEPKNEPAVHNFTVTGATGAGERRGFGKHEMVPSTSRLSEMSTQMSTQRSSTLQMTSSMRGGHVLAPSTSMHMDRSYEDSQNTPEDDGVGVGMPAMRPVASASVSKNAKRNKP